MSEKTMNVFATNDNDVSVTKNRRCSKQSQAYLKLYFGATKG